MVKSILAVLAARLAGHSHLLHAMIVGAVLMAFGVVNMLMKQSFLSATGFLLDFPPMWLYILSYG